jgi:hypothetical protein
MNGDDRLEPRFPIGDEVHDLMVVEIGKIPKRLHAMILL